MYRFRFCNACERWKPFSFYPQKNERPNGRVCRSCSALKRKDRPRKYEFDYHAERPICDHCGCDDNQGAQPIRRRHGDPEGRKYHSFCAGAEEE